MAIEKIEFIADHAGIHPATKKDSGYKLDIAAYAVKVTLTDELLTQLNNSKGGGTLVYRFDVYNASGDYDRTQTQALDDAPIEYTLTKRDTRISGMVRIIPIVTSVLNDVAIYEKRLGTITLNVKATPEKDNDFASDSRSLSSLERSAKEAAVAAQAALEDCLEAKEATEAARTAIEGNNVTVVFDGGDSETEFPVSLVVDNFLTENGRNPVTAAAIFAALELLESDMRSAINTTVAAKVAEATADIASTIKSDIYRDNRVIITMDNVNPGSYLGGTWERCGQGRVLVGVDEEDSDFDAPGKTGGEKEHTLTTNEMPNHHHMIWQNPSAGAGSGEYEGLAYVVQSGLSQYGRYGQTSQVGSNQPHNNTPPYLTCYFWVKVPDNES